MAKCERTGCSGDDWYRGYCSTYCQDMHEVEQERDYALGERDACVRAAQAVTRERDEARARCTALEAEMTRLNRRLSIVSLVVSHELELDEQQLLQQLVDAHRGEAP